MKKVKSIRQIISVIACLGIVFSMLTMPPAVKAEENAAKTTLVNLFSDPGFDESGSKNLLTDYDGTLWRTTRSVVNIGDNNWAVADSLNAQYTANQRAGFGMKLNAPTISGHKYYFNCKAKLFDECTQNTLTMIVGVGGGIGYIDISKTEKTYSSNITASASIAANANNGARITTHSYKVNTKFAVDDLYIYDVTNAKKITAGSEITLSPECYANIDGNKMTNAGDIVDFSVNVPYGYTVKTVKVGEDIVQPVSDSNIYSFTMPENDVSISAEFEQKKMSNLVENGDMETADTRFFAPFASCNHTIEYETANGNAYLTFDASKTTDNTMSSIVAYPLSFLNGNKYYVELKGMASRETMDAISNTGISLWIDLVDGGGVSRWINGSFTKVCFSKEVALTDTQSSDYLRIAGQGNKTAKFSIDDVKVYNITGAAALSYDAEGGIIIPDEKDGIVIDEINRIVYAMPGDSITFSFIPFATDGKYIDTSCEKISGEKYSLNVTSDMTKIPVSCTDLISYSVQDDQIAVKSHEPGEKKLIIGLFESDALVNAEIHDITTEAADETKIVTDSLAASGDGYIKKYFFFNNFEQIRPLRKAGAAASDEITLFTIGDITAYKTSANADQKGWAGYINEFFRDNVTVTDKSAKMINIRDYLKATNYADVKAAWKPGDYALISFGLNEGAITVDEYTESLNTIINEAKNAGVNVIVVKEQKSADETTNSKALPYINAAEAAANAAGAECIDLWSRTDSYPSGCIYTDNIGLTGNGAKYIAGLLSEEISSSGSDLRYYIK